MHGAKAYAGLVLSAGDHVARATHSMDRDIPSKNIWGKEKSLGGIAPRLSLLVGEVQ
jgi:hypothetical protein